MSQDSAEVAAWIAAVASVLGLTTTVGIGLVGTEQGRNLVCDYTSVFCPAREESFAIDYIDYLGIEHATPSVPATPPPPGANLLMKFENDTEFVPDPAYPLDAWDTLRSALGPTNLDRGLTDTVSPQESGICLRFEQLEDLFTSGSHLKFGEQDWDLFASALPNGGFALTEAILLAPADKLPVRRRGLVDTAIRYRPLKRDMVLTVALRITLPPWPESVADARYAAVLRSGSEFQRLLCPLPPLPPGEYLLHMQTWGDLGDRDPPSKPLSLHVEVAPDPPGLAPPAPLPPPR